MKEQSCFKARMMWCSGNESLPMANNRSIIWKVRYQGYVEFLVQPHQMRHMTVGFERLHDAPYRSGVSLVLLNNPMNRCHSAALIQSGPVTKY
jgi:hypothetical protein